jgi:hypothetical protein|tara:strand:- start:2002 stop:2259 length:258 start_codon:yes stop_codon:yes gene_type:complete
VNDDYFDELVNGRPTLITDKQWFIIESMIDRTSLSIEYKTKILNKINDLTEIEAEEVITNIFENEIKTDPKDQWLKMLKDGVFNS